MGREFAVDGMDRRCGHSSEGTTEAISGGPVTKLRVKQTINALQYLTAGSGVSQDSHIGGNDKWIRHKTYTFNPNGWMPK